MAEQHNLTGDSTLSYLFNRVWDKLYPVGAIYISSNATSPEKLFGGKWKPIEDQFLLAAGRTYKAGDTGGKANYVAADMPKHSHTRGSMDITGSIDHVAHTQGIQYGINLRDSGNSGAFASYESLPTYTVSQIDYVSGGHSGISFVASRSWTGSTSESGSKTTAEIMPPYRVVYAWERTA